MTGAPADLEHALQRRFVALVAIWLVLCALVTLFAARNASAAAVVRFSTPQVESVGAQGEVKRLVEVRVPELIAFQDEAYARRYAEVFGVTKPARSTVVAELVVTGALVEIEAIAVGTA